MRLASIHGLARSAGVAVLSGAASALLLAPAASAEPATGQIISEGTSAAIGNSYLVALDDSQSVTPELAASLTARYGGRVAEVYDGDVLNGFSAQLSRAQAARLAANPVVAYVEQDQRVDVTGIQVNPPSWGLDRVDQRTVPLNRQFSYGASDGMYVYVLDTGVRITHREFDDPDGAGSRTGRASYGYDTVDEDRIASDTNGHGTFVAGVIAGRTYGVAKSARIVSVRVLGSNGSGTLTDVIEGINWVTRNAIRPAVANMSLSGPASPSLDRALEASINAGVTYTFAAGNLGVDASGYSPARVTRGITVGATSRTDRRAYWSNYGASLDLFAPGDAIVSAWSSSDTAALTASGTSFAAPHVAGAAAVYLRSHRTASPSMVRNALVAYATTRVVVNAGRNSPNRLLYLR